MPLVHEEHSPIGKINKLCDKETREGEKEQADDNNAMYFISFNHSFFLFTFLFMGHQSVTYGGENKQKAKNCYVLRPIVGPIGPLYFVHMPLQCIILF